MSYQNNQNATTYSTTGAIDQGLQAFMRSVFNAMGAGLVVTGLTAFGVSQVPALFNAIFGTPLQWVVIFAPLAFLFLGFTPSRIARMDAAKLHLLFIAFSAVMGISMAVIFKVFTAESIARVFFITAATFAATSLYGYTTKRDLSSMGSFLFMGVIGLVIASVVNLFLQSTMVHFVVSALGVLIFTGLTAYDTQRLKETYSSSYGAAEANAKLAVMGALSLYLNFINLFQSLMNLMGERE